MAKHITQTDLRNNSRGMGQGRAAHDIDAGIYTDARRGTESAADAETSCASAWDDTGNTIRTKKSRRPRQKRQWTAPRRALLAVTLFLLCVEIGLYTSSPDTLAAGHLVPALMLMGLTLALNWNIFPVAMLYMTIWAVMALTPTANGNPFMPAFLLCVVVVILNCTVRQMLWSFLVPAIAFTIMLIADQQRFRLFSVSGIGDEFVTLALNIALAALAGLSIRFALKAQEARAQKAELRLARAEADRLSRDILLAGQMHDNLTNDLTTILTLAYAHTHGTDDDPSGDWDRVSQSADHALSTAHKAIDVLRGHGENRGNVASFARHSSASASSGTEISDLDNSDLCGVAAGNPDMGDGTGTGNGRGDSFPLMLENVAQKEAGGLSTLGFSGSVNIDPVSLPGSVSPAVRDEAVRLVREICANVRRHGSKDGDWSLSIRGENIRGKNPGRQTNSGQEISGRAVGQSDGNVRHAADRVGTGFSGQALVIIGMNTIDGNRPIIGASGRGLQLHRQAIARLGGTLATSSDDGVWTIRAVIPVHPSLDRGLGQ